MTGPVIAALAAVVVVAAAVRSIWSPCGLSMLSTITPFGERSRGHRYGFTAAWFVIGSTAGGATLGAVAAGLAALLATAGLAAHPGSMAGLAAVAAFVAAGVDAGAFGEVIPLWRRQVDDRWLVRYRRWVYAAGFGWQIGVGLATYIMTAAVFLVVVLGALSADPVAAVAVCTGFGLVRGMAVLLTARADTPERLRQWHHRFDQLGPVVRVAVIVLQLLVGTAAVMTQWPVTGAALSGGLLAVTGAVLARRRPKRVGPRRAG